MPTTLAILGLTAVVVATLLLVRLVLLEVRSLQAAVRRVELKVNDVAIDCDCTEGGELEPPQSIAAAVKEFCEDDRPTDALPSLHLSDSPVADVDTTSGPAMVAFERETTLPSSGVPPLKEGA